MISWFKRLSHCGTQRKERKIESALSSPPPSLHAPPNASSAISPPSLLTSSIQPSQSHVSSDDSSDISGSPIQSIDDHHLFGHICSFLEFKDKLTSLITVSQDINRLLDPTLCYRTNSLVIYADNASIRPPLSVNNNHETADIEESYQSINHSIKSHFSFASRVAQLVINWDSSFATIDQSVWQSVNHYKMINQAMKALAVSDALISLSIVQYRTDIAFTGLSVDLPFNQPNNQSNDHSINNNRWIMRRVCLGSLYLEAVQASGKVRKLERFEWQDTQSPQYDVLICGTDWSVFELFPHLKSLHLDFSYYCIPWALFTWTTDLLISFLSCLPCSLKHMRLHAHGIDSCDWSQVFQSTILLPHLQTFTCCEIDEKTHSIHKTIVQSLACTVMSTTNCIRPITHLPGFYDVNQCPDLLMLDHLTALCLSLTDFELIVPSGRLSQLRALVIKASDPFVVSPELLISLATCHLEFISLPGILGSDSISQLVDMQHLRSLCLHGISCELKPLLSNNCWPQLSRLEGKFSVNHLVAILSVCHSMCHVETTMPLDLSELLCKIAPFCTRLQKLKVGNCLDLSDCLQLIQVNDETLKNLPDKCFPMLEHLDLSSSDPDMSALDRKCDGFRRALLILKKTCCLQYLLLPMWFRDCAYFYSISYEIVTSLPHLRLLSPAVNSDKFWEPHKLTSAEKVHLNRTKYVGFTGEDIEANPSLLLHTDYNEMWLGGDRAKLQFRQGKCGKDGVNAYANHMLSKVQLEQTNVSMTKRSRPQG